MSTPLARALAPQRGIRPERSERRLRAVDAPGRRRRPKLLYGIVALLGAVAIAAAQMSLSISYNFV